MIKIKQRIFNGTLREAYLSDLRRSVCQLHTDKKIISASKILHQTSRPSIGTKPLKPRGRNDYK